MPGPIVAPNPATEAYRQQLFRQLAAVPADVRGFIADQYGTSQISVLPLPYWSTARFQATVAGNVATVASGTTVKAFAYAQGQSMAIAGFPAAFRVATLADTNLLTQSQTRDNADVWIWGLAAAPTPDSEPLLLREVWRKCSIAISLNGTQTIPLGTHKMFPGAGGLYGTGMSAAAIPSLSDAGLTPTGAGAGDAGPGAPVSFLSNGNPMAGNFFRLPQPFKWAAIGTAGSDSSLTIQSTAEAALTYDVGAARAAAAGVAQYTAPAAGGIGTFADIQWHLICVAVAKRSVNA